MCEQVNERKIQKFKENVSQFTHHLVPCTVYDNAERLSDSVQSLAHCLKVYVIDMIFATKEGLCNISPNAFVLNNMKIWKY
jgi:hypothetical protein